jgi:arylsulfatase A-like enzyme
MVRIPIILSSAALPARKLDTPVSLIDLGPTILDLFGLATPATFDGESLLPVMRGEPLNHPILMDSGRHMRAEVFADGYKVIEDRRLGYVELYDLNTDPYESQNLADALPEETAERVSKMDAYLGTDRELPYVTP